MRTIVHLSDLHFGRVNQAILPGLRAFLQQVNPDLVAVSGDLTQRAKTAEFHAARAFLDSIPFPQIVVPGNHDVPLYNVFARFARGLKRYRRFITDDLAPFFADEQLAVAGVNTARSLTFKSGRINPEQVAQVRAQFRGLSGDHTKVVVTHHPFDLPAGAEDGKVVGRAQEAMEALSECGVDLLLAGHFHIAEAGSTTRRFRIPGYSALIVSCGTTTSTRGRGQPNSCNVIRTERQRIGVERWEWQSGAGRFERRSDEHFLRTPDGWSAAT
jgi:3',5'-cyclic AMP phosphodiesterase CpdA